MHEQMLGQFLVRRGDLTEAQVETLMGLQKTDQRRIGTLAVERYGIPRAVVDAAAVELHRQRSPEVSLASEAFDPQCLHLITPQQAWDNLVLPLRKANGELVCATAEETLSAAIDLMETATDQSYRFVLAEMRPLEQFIAERYSFEGVNCVEAA